MMMKDWVTLSIRFKSACEVTMNLDLEDYQVFVCDWLSDQQYFALPRKSKSASLLFSRSDVDHISKQDG